MSEKIAKLVITDVCDELTEDVSRQLLKNKWISLTKLKLDLNRNQQKDEIKCSDHQRVESNGRGVKKPSKRLDRKTPQKLNKISVFKTTKTIKIVGNKAIITDKSSNKSKTIVKSIETPGREVVPTTDLVPVCGSETVFRTPNNNNKEVVLKSILKNSTNWVSKPPPKKRSRIIRQLFVNELTLSEINCETKMEIQFKSLSLEPNGDQNKENSNTESNSQQKLPKKKKKKIFNTENTEKTDKTFRINLDFIGKDLNSDNTNEVKKSNGKQLMNNREFVGTNEIIDGKVVDNGEEFVPFIELSAEDLISLNELLDPELPSIPNKAFEKFGAQKLANIRKLEKEVKRKENEIQRFKDLIDDTPNRHHQMWVRAKLEKYCPICESQVLTSKFKLILRGSQGDGADYFCSAHCLDQNWNSHKGIAEE